MLQKKRVIIYLSEMPNLKNEKLEKKQKEYERLKKELGHE